MPSCSFTTSEKSATFPNPEVEDGLAFSLCGTAQLLKPFWPKFNSASKDRKPILPDSAAASE